MERLQQLSKPAPIEGAVATLRLRGTLDAGSKRWKYLRRGSGYTVTTGRRVKGWQTIYTGFFITGLNETRWLVTTLHL